ncbi:MAG: A/G-specific adenine glycosylase [Chitinophagaceae bacterium]|nr:MAG: A/G-specific adenine glycosylase [Chitinophagaceae bacterium]
MLKNTQFLPGPAFATLLLRWNARENEREMPWKGEKDPYLIWLSEIILQQTRVEQGMAYYNRFREKYPAITDLAAAPDDEVMKLWEGLGYYSRCRNLLATARIVTAEYGGRFPSDYESILGLRGIGPYTAAAISSFAFGLPHAVVDGNVFRVLARVFGVFLPTDSTAGKKYFTALAGQLLDEKNPAAYNQAIMDFGAVICKPAVPLCHKCIFNQHCYAFREKETANLPVKEKKTKVRKRWFYYLILESGNRTAIRQRTEKGIWQQLYEFPVIETEQEAAVGDVLLQAEEMGVIRKDAYEVHAVSPMKKQQLSHQLIAGRFIHLRLKEESCDLAGSGGIWIGQEELSRYAFPRFINQYLEEPPVQSLF